MKPLNLFFAAVLTLVVVAPTRASADIVINEIDAANSERNLRSHPDGRSRLGWGPSWSEPTFDASDWSMGTSPFGFDNDGIETDVGDEMDGRTPSLYLRKTFTVTADEAAKEFPFRLTAAADSGFVAFVNGHEIARGNLGRLNGFVFHDQSAFSSAERNDKLKYDSEVIASDVLVAGENVLAVQVQNTVPRQINERDPKPDTTLKFEGSLVIGRGIFAGESTTVIDLPDNDWQYRVGYTEPSGGLVDWAHAAHADVEAGFSDWIELHNNGAAEVDLTGWSLSDDEDTPQLWSFPEGTKIAADGYLLVLADGNTTVPGDYIHASFGLAGDGEFLGLADASGEFVSQFEGSYPRQDSFHSYGVSTTAEGGFVYFAEPSPGAANGGVELSDHAKKPKFDMPGGVYDDTVVVTLTSNTEGAEIRYTLDGSEPTVETGLVYTEPLTIETIDERTGTPIRARAFMEGMIPSNESTQTYLVGLDEAFKTIPSVSFVADDGYAFYAPHGITSIEGGSGRGNDWNAREAQDYYMPDMHGRPFERRVSMEVMYPEDGTNVQIDAGIRLAASAWSRGRFNLNNTDRSPWAHSGQDKPSFNIFFRGDYGDDTLNFPIVENYPVRSFRQLRMRAGKNDAQNPWITDELSRRLTADTGQFASIGVQTALFLNGVYKGYFNTVARLREELFQDLYGDDAPWQVKHIDVWADGSPFQDDLLADTPEWDHLESLLEKDLTVQENYDAVLQELDPVNFADYFIVNCYGATWDWPHNNLVIARALSEEGRWRAYMWDAEGMFGVAGGHGINYNSMTADLNRTARPTPSDDLATVWQALVTSSEFRLTFADRLQKHFFTPGGALTEDNLTRRVDELEAEIEELMSFSGGGNIRTSSIRSWISRREDVLFKSDKQFEDEDLWGGVQVPSYSPKGGAVDAGKIMKITVGSLFNKQNGDIFYTIDGSDPRLPGGATNPTAILYDRDANTGLTIDDTMTVKSRVFNTTLFNPEGEWSALREATYRVGLQPATGENLIISELMVAPAKPNEAEDAAEFSSSNFEFLEFYNPSNVSVDLGELRFTAGINYLFKEGDVSTLGPKSYGVIVNDRAAFAMRYGDSAKVLGEFNKKLKNGGEHLEISNGSYEPIIGVTYSNDPPWPANDGENLGFSLVRTSLAADIDYNVAENWKASAALGGTPGRAEGADPEPSDGYDTWKAEFLAGLDDAPTADPDGDGDSNLAEFAFGSLPNDAVSTVLMETAVSDDFLTLTLNQREGVDGLSYILEKSMDLEAWETIPAADLVEMSSQSAGAGLKKVTLQTTTTVGNTAGYVRWRVELTP
ncbi:MAG: lamin tail domain-containing protein [Verrucomicrobiales bacterium]